MHLFGARSGAALVAFVALGASAAIAAEPDPFWGTDWKTAKTRAAAEQKPILLDFAAEWCGPCHAMDEQFWPRPEVRAAAERFVRVRLDFDKPNQASRRFWITAIPAVLVLDPWGNLLLKEVGFGETDEVLDALTTIPDDFAPLAVDSLAAATGRADGVTLLRLGEHYLKLGMPTGSNSFLELAVKAKDIKAQPRRRADAYVAIGLNLLQLHDSEKARLALEQAFAIEGGPERADEGLFGLVVAWCRLAKPERARSSLDQLDRNHPDSDATKAAHRLFASNCSG